MSILINNIPMELRSKPQWVGWTLIEDRKVPMCPMTGKAAQSSNPDTWGSFTQALAVYRKNKWKGLGFVFNKDYVGIDLDDCVNGKINSYAQDILKTHNSYTEFSPSGTGIHIIAKGTIPRALKTDKIEIYNTGRYFTVTGKLVQGRKIIKPVDFSQFYSGEVSQQTTEDKLQNLKPGNVDITLTSLAGSLFRKGFSYNEVFLMLKEKANQAGHDDKALRRICTSVNRYHSQGGYGSLSVERAEEEERKPIEIFTPATHYDEYEKLLTEGKGPIKLPSGFPTIDRYTGGLKKGSIWVVGARTNIGKTSLSITIANNLLRVGKKVLIFSTEMDWVETMSRFNAIGTGVSLHTITNAPDQLTNEDKQRIKENLRGLKSKPLYIIQEPDPNLRVLDEEISRIQPDVFIFDYVQHIEEKADHRHKEIGKFMKGAENIAKKYKCAAIITSQLNRAADTEIPILRHLSDSSTIENTSRVVILLSELSKANNGDSITIADIAKNRGPKGRVELVLDGVTMGFKEQTYET